MLLLLPPVAPGLSHAVMSTEKVPDCVGVPVICPDETFTIVGLLIPSTVNPGGSCPEKVKDPAGAGAPVAVKFTAVIGVPTVPFTFVGDTTSWVAPASEFTAPRETSAAAADFSTAPTGEAMTISSATAATRTTGVRCSSA